MPSPYHDGKNGAIHETAKIVLALAIYSPLAFISVSRKKFIQICGLVPETVLSEGLETNLKFYENGISESMISMVGIMNPFLVSRRVRSAVSSFHVHSSHRSILQGQHGTFSTVRECKQLIYDAYFSLTGLEQLAGG